MEIRPATGTFGADVSGVDLATDLDDATIAAIRSAFNEHHVLFFRDQDLSPEAQIAFGRRLVSSTPTPSSRATPPTPRSST